MGWWRWVARRAEVLFAKRRVEAELDDELRFHLEMEVREHKRTGLSPAEARRRAMVTFGGVERYKEEVRDVRGARVADDLMQDVRVAVRSLTKQPAFLAAVLTTLAVGIGGSVAIYAVLDATVFAALPYPEADRLVTGRSTFNDGARLGPMLSAYDFYDYRDQARSFSAVGAIAPFPRRSTISQAGEPTRADVVFVTPGFFTTLGVTPLHGRDFVAEEGEPGASPAVLISEGYWRDRLGEDASVVGTTLVVSGNARTVVGVLPRTARFMVDADLWIPVVRGEGMARSRSAHNFLMVARLRADASAGVAQSELDAISDRLEDAYPDSNAGKGIVLTPARDMLAESYRGTLALLAAAVGLLLVVACANVAGLLLARGQARISEMALRSAIGARRGRLTRQLLTESTVLALGGGALGLSVAWLGQRAVLAFVSVDRIGAVAPGLSPSTVMFALTLSVGTVLFFGAIPALRTSGADASVALRGAGKVAGGVGGSRLRGGLVVAQVALTAVLLSVSGLLMRSLQELSAVDLGFNAENLLTAELDLPAFEYSPEERVAFFDDLNARLGALPDVRAVALSSMLPVRDPGNNWGIGLPGELSTPRGRSFLAFQRVVYPGYFEAMGIPLLAGRDVEPSDRDGEPRAIVISESTAERLFGEETSTGRLVDVQGQDDAHIVVGVVGDVVTDRPRSGRGPSMYYPYHRRTPALMRIALRHSGQGASVAAQVRSTLASLDPNLPLDRVLPMEDVVDASASDERALAALVAVFAAVALLLAGVGLYGVLAYQVTRRLREIGVRMALGASVADVSASVVRGGLMLVAAGLVVGVPLSLFVGRFLQAFLFGIEPADPVTYLTVSLFLAVVAAVACLLPARRASRVDPVQAFRA